MKAFFLLFFILFSKISDAQSFKLFRYGYEPNEKPAVELITGERIDVSAFGEDFNEKFFATDGISRLKEWLSINIGKCPKIKSMDRWAPCVARPSKIVGIGLNYALHAKESNQTIPFEPIIFLKSTTSLSGPNDNIPIPLNSTKLDWEVELAIIIGKKAKYVTVEEAKNYIAGYAVANDVSERNFQTERTGQWTKGKSHDGFCPLGPYLVLAEDIQNVQNLNMHLDVNGQQMQNSSTSDMIFNVKQIVSSVSHYMTLLPGDVIVTGTPSGVGMGRKPQQFLKAEDTVTLEIEGLGKQKQRVISFIESQLTAREYEQFKAWTAIGVGGLPHTLEGYRTLQVLNKNLKNPFDISHLSDKLKTNADLINLKKLPMRVGPKPTIAPFAIPHRQLDQHNSITIREKQKKIFDEIQAKNQKKVMYKKSFFERNNDALFLMDSAAGNNSISPYTHGEIGHIHPSDGSMHFTLSPSDTKEVLAKGWGELHGLAGLSIRQDASLSETYTIIYSPRDDKELAIVKQIIQAAINYALHLKK